MNKKKETPGEDDLPVFLLALLKELGVTKMKKLPFRVSNNRILSSKNSTNTMAQRQKNNTKRVCMAFRRKEEGSPKQPYTPLSFFCIKQSNLRELKFFIYYED